MPWFREMVMANARFYYLWNCCEGHCPSHHSVSYIKGNSLHKKSITEFFLETFPFFPPEKKIVCSFFSDNENCVTYRWQGAQSYLAKHERLLSRAVCLIWMSDLSVTEFSAWFSQGWNGMRNMAKGTKNGLCNQRDLDSNPNPDCVSSVIAQ